MLLVWFQVYDSIDSRDGEEAAVSMKSTAKVFLVNGQYNKSNVD